VINKRGQKGGTQRGNRQRFPYEPRVVGGRLLRPAELQAIHRYVVETRATLLRHVGRTSHGSVTQIKWPPTNPGRFKVMLGAHRSEALWGQLLGKDHQGNG
jgi:hypothetical protein